MDNLLAPVCGPVGTALVLPPFQWGMARGDTGDDDAEGTVPGRPCPHCGASMTHRHCKYVCPEHGVVYDCSDTFY
jgi:hypothetical protein